MKQGERGFTLIEVLVVIAIVASIAAAATMSTFQVLNVTKRSNDHMVTIRQVQNAGYWISRDALMAQNIVVDDDDTGTQKIEFLTLKWAEWDYEDGSIYHEVTYSFQELPDDIPDELWKLSREHVIYEDKDKTDVKESKTTLVAKYIYYDSENPDNDNTNATYKSPDESPEQAPVLTVQITSSLGEASETREYRVLPRPDF